MLHTFWANVNWIKHEFICRTAMELIAAGILMIFFARFGEIDGISTAMFSCYVHEVPFNCVIPNHRFFMVNLIFEFALWFSYCYVCLLFVLTKTIQKFQVIYMMAVLMLLCYFLLTTYNLLWLVHPKVPRLERILSGWVLANI